ncbi:hypothetical protein ACWDNI_35730 [Nocardia niigatensis]
MTEIQPYGFGEATALQLVETTAPTRGDRSREWLELFFQTEKAAQILAATDFAPPSMKGKPAAVAAAMMKGYELDIDPLDALGNIYSVHGQIGFKAEFMRRRIIQAGHEFTVVEANDTRAIVEGRRKGAEKWERASFTADQARKAKIDLGGYPEDKLVARATSRLVKRIFPDVMSGAAIAEDLEDQARMVAVPSERADAPALTVTRKRKPRAVAAPPAEPEPQAEAAPAGDMPPLPGEDEEPLPVVAEVDAEGEMLPFVNAEGGAE